MFRSIDPGAQGWADSCYSLWKWKRLFRWRRLSTLFLRLLSSPSTSSLQLVYVVCDFWSVKSVGTRRSFVWCSSTGLGGRLQRCVFAVVQLLPQGPGTIASTMGMILGYPLSVPLRSFWLKSYLRTKPVTWSNLVFVVLDTIRVFGNLHCKFCCCVFGALVCWNQVLWWTCISLRFRHWNIAPFISWIWVCLASPTVRPWALHCFNFDFLVCSFECLDFRM